MDMNKLMRAVAIADVMAGSSSTSAERESAVWDIVSLLKDDAGSNEIELPDGRMLEYEETPITIVRYTVRLISRDGYEEFETVVDGENYG